ncbi:MAG: 4Fe-4S binding protein [Anaerolineae bacterium]|nr:4Fe-4S binding protein [Anaerolineae bacterium]
MYGTGILKGLGVTFRNFVNTFVADVRWLGRRRELTAFQEKQSLKYQGMVTVEYPDEKLAMPERFRFTPFLVTYNNDDPEYPGKDWCTSCGICAKVCPPQCIWIVRGTNPQTGRPVPEPEQFYIDIDICMNCGYCAEYCPFDAIKMDHDYELASYDRTSAHIHDKKRLSKEIRYWQAIAPTTAAEEEAARGGYDHTDVQKARKKQGLPASRPGPISERAPQPVVAPAAEGAATVAEPVAAQVAGTAAPAPAAGAAVTPDGKPIVRRRGAGAGATAKPAGEVTPATAPPPTPEAAPVGTAETAGASADVAKAPSTDVSATEQTPDGLVRRGKRLIDPNAPVQVVRRKNPPKTE